MLGIVQCMILTHITLQISDDLDSFRQTWTGSKVLGVRVDILLTVDHFCSSNYDEGMELSP